MAKQKTNKSAAKRIAKRTRSGHFVARPMSAQHRTRGKSSRVLRRSRSVQKLSKADNKRLEKLLPNL